MVLNRRTGLVIAGVAGLVAVAVVAVLALRHPAMRRDGSLDAGMASAVPVPSPQSACLHKGIAVSLGKAKFRVPGPPALTVITGAGVDDEIDFATKAGLEKACLSPQITAKAMALNLAAMDKTWGPAAEWRADFCADPANDAVGFLCDGEARDKGSPRRLALLAVYDPKDFDGEAMFRQPAPSLAEFTAWRDKMTKAGTPPPVQADGAFDVYPGGIWLERDSKDGAPFLFSCDADALPVTGPHYCIGRLEMEDGLRARVEFRTVSGQVGTEAAAVKSNLRSLLAAWQ